MLRNLAAVALASFFTACGAQMDDGGPGGSASSAGGNVSFLPGAAGGGEAVSTGGSTAVNMQNICNGYHVCSNSTPQIITNVTTCDIPLQWSPQPGETVVLLDCGGIMGVAPDAGTADGYYLDYNQSPVHLELTGSTCTAVLTNGSASLAVFESCYID